MMTTIQLQSEKQTVLQRAWGINRPTTALVLTTIATGVIAAVGMAVDPRMMLGQSIWAKTFKFSLSMAIYGATLLWFASYLPRTRWFRLLLNATGTVLLLEIGLIVVQAVRGRMMHFNYSTPLDTTLYLTMAVSIYVLWIASAIAGVMLVRERMAANRPLAWGVRLGLIITIAAGFGLGVLMTTPTAEQMVLFETADPAAGQVIGGHTVGAVDGGPGLPVLGWSTTHGDLRIGHFFGLHALQLLPLVGLFLTQRRERWLTDSHKVALVGVTGAAYVGWLGLVTWQALRAEAFVRPSSLTLTGLGVLVGATALAVGATLTHARRNH